MTIVGEVTHTHACSIHRSIHAKQTKIEVNMESAVNNVKSSHYEASRLPLYPEEVTATERVA